MKSVIRRESLSPPLESSSSALFEFLLFDMLRLPPTDDDELAESSFFGVNAVFRFISVLDDCDEPDECKRKNNNEDKIQTKQLYSCDDHI